MHGTPADPCPALAASCSSFNSAGDGDHDGLHQHQAAGAHASSSKPRHASPVVFVHQLTNPARPPGTQPGPPPVRQSITTRNARTHRAKSRAGVNVFMRRPARLVCLPALRRRAGLFAGGPASPLPLGSGGGCVGSGTCDDVPGRPVLRCSLPSSPEKRHACAHPS